MITNSVYVFSRKTHNVLLSNIQIAIHFTRIKSEWRANKVSFASSSD